MTHFSAGVLPLTSLFIMSRGKKSKKLSKEQENNQCTIVDDVSASKIFLSPQDVIRCTTLLPPFSYRWL